MTLADTEADDECDCICNHSGACTGCGICWVKAWHEWQDAQMCLLFGRSYLDRDLG